MLTQEVIVERLIFRQVPGDATLAENSRGMRTDCSEGDIKCAGYFLRTHASRVCFQDIKRTFVSQRLFNAFASSAFLKVYVILHGLCRVGYMLDTSEIGCKCLNSMRYFLANYLREVRRGDSSSVSL